MEKVIIIGAGPCGLSTAIELKKNGIDPLIIEKGCIVNSIYRFPTHMNFFSSSELLEVGEVPFMSQHEKPTRLEALKYYREVAKRYELRIQTYEKVEMVQKHNEGFQLQTTTRNGEQNIYKCKYLVISTGYYDNPNIIGIKGENLSKVSHYFTEAHPYHGLNVAIIGGKNSAVDAAMELEKAGAKVTIIYRGMDYSPSIKPWVRPVFESLVQKERIEILWGAQVEEIKPESILIRQGEKVFERENDFVFALTGYRPDRTFFDQLGTKVDPNSGEPEHNPETMETNVDNLYISGVIAAGNNANVIFIENGRFHGNQIAKAIASRN